MRCLPASHPLSTFSSPDQSCWKVSRKNARPRFANSVETPATFRNLDGRSGKCYCARLADIRRSSGIWGYSQNRVGICDRCSTCLLDGLVEMLQLQLASFEQSVRISVSNALSETRLL